MSGAQAKTSPRAAASSNSVSASATVGANGFRSRHACPSCVLRGSRRHARRRSWIDYGLHFGVVERLGPRYSPASETPGQFLRAVRQSGGNAAQGKAARACHAIETPRRDASRADDAAAGRADLGKKNEW